MFYYIVFFVLAIISCLELIEVPWRTKKWIYISTLVFMVLISGLRWKTGNDWNPYYRFYTTFDADDPFFMVAMETGFALFVRFLRFFSTNFTFYLFVLGLLVISLKGFFFYRFTSAILLAALLYWGTVMSDVTAVRQNLAISICAISTIYIVEKKPWLFLLFVLLAMQIHITAIIYLFSYKIYHLNWRVSSKYIWLTVAIALGLIGGSENVLELAISLIPDGFGFDRITQKAEVYLEIGNEKIYGANLSKGQRMAAALAKRAVLLPIFFFFQERFEKVSDHYKGFLNLYTFGNVLFFIFLDFLTLQRTATYFYMFEILVFCIIYENVKSRSIWFLLIVVYSLFKLFSLIASGSDFLVPYIWIFSADTNRYFE